MKHYPPVLLASASFGGTLAAARELGAMGIDVRVISSEFLGAAAQSRYVTRRYSAPPEFDSDKFLDRLLKIGRADPGQILLPTSDSTAWLYTVNDALLQRYFRLHQPSLSTMQRISDKMLFHEAVMQAGLYALPTWDPRTNTDLEKLAPALPYPILIKPRTHVCRRINDKGMVVASAGELLARYRNYLARNSDNAVDIPQLPDANRPVLQQFVDVGPEGVNSITGFIDRTGKLIATRRSSKVLLRSRPVGVGVCFQSLPPDQELSEAVYRLCREIDYFGIFEVEFVRHSGRWCPIDFNARLFGQLGLDIGRGMPLPLFAFLAAAGETDALQDAVVRARSEDRDPRPVFWDHFTMRAILLAQTVTLGLSQRDRAYWREWIKQNVGRSIDVAFDRRDPIPMLFHALSEVFLGLKALPRFLKSPRLSSPAAYEISTQP